MIAYAKISLSTPLTVMKQNFGHMDAGWAAHFNTSHYEGTWTALPLRTPGGLDTIIPGLSGDEIYADHPNMAKFPGVKDFLDTLYCEVMSARLLNLSSGSVIKQHRDMELAFENGEARLHIPLYTNPGVEFYVNDERVIMDEGSCWYINANLPHRVANHGSTDRIHLIIDCKVNAWLSDIITQSELIAFKQETIDPNLPAIIAELRRQNTTASSKLADTLEKQLTKSKEEQ